MDASIAGLSADQLELFAQLLAEEGITSAPAQTIPRRSDATDPPLSFAQQRLWFLHQMEPESAAYNLPVPLRLTGSLNLPALEQSIQALVERHESLRTTFRMVDGQAVQVIAAFQPGVAAIALSVIDLSDLPAAEREASVRRLATEDSERPFDLQQGPLFRVTLLRLSDQEHVLLLTMHHIISDSWSLRIFVRDLMVFYTAFAQGDADALKAQPPLPIQYADFALWQREQLQGELLEEHLAYWKEHLAGAPAVLELPTDHPRPAIQRQRGMWQSIRIPEPLTDALRALSRAEDTTLFMTLLAAFEIALQRYSGQDDLVVGTPIANRPLSETHDLIGFFANTLALRTNLEGDPTFCQLLERVRATALGAYAHQDLPFEKLVEELQPRRDLSHTPIFQVVFVLDNGVSSWANDDLERAGLQLSVLGVDNGTAKFDLTLNVVDLDSTLLMTIVYNTDLFEAATISRLLDQLHTLLRNIVDKPDQRISQLSLLPAAERDLLLSWNQATSYPTDRCLHHWFEEQAAQRPTAIAAIFPDPDAPVQQLTYDELNQRANQLAHYLQGLGIGPGTLVGLCVERSLEIVIGILGILKAGGAYLPLDPAYPAERIQFMLEDAQAPVVLCQERLRDQLPATGVRRVALDTAWAEIAAGPSHNPASSVSSRDVAYVIYTSGSTGRPKGVQVEHRQVARLFTATDDWFHFNENDVWTLFHSYAFDFSVWELWGALLYGGKLVVVPFFVTRSPDALYELIHEQGVTVLNQTPSAFRQLIAAEQGVNPPAQPLALRYVIFGGEALEPQMLRPWIERHGDDQPQLINMYGITETTVHVTYRRITAADLATAQRSPIGRPIPDLRVYVLDRYFNPVPIGVPGEMYVGGAGVARGYLNRPELTSERFIADPFSPDVEARLYKTGDLARYLANGELEFLGRIDQQVKIRGFRIELGEIEAALMKHPAVQTAIVRAHADHLGDQRLVAYVVGSKEQRTENKEQTENREPNAENQGDRSDGSTFLVLSSSQLRAFLQRNLPDYMVPAAFMFLDALPLTNNGKIDDRRLPLPGSERPDLAQVYVAPQTAAETIMAEIWADVLNLERVGVEDNFFALGGDSIRSVRLLALAKQRGLHFSLQQLFQLQTIRALAGEATFHDRPVETALRTAPFSLIAESDRARLPAEIEDAYPLTMLQAGMIYHMALRPDSPVYHNVDSFHFRARLNLDALQQAVDRVVARHPVLRTSFELTQYSEALQLVHRQAALQVQADDLRGLSLEEQETTIRAYIEREQQRRFDLRQPPLLRFHIHRRSDETFQFTITECHAILDGWSLHSTLAEIFGIYFALLNQRELPDQTPLASSFRDFVALERQALASPDHQRYWAEVLRDAVVMTLPRWPQQNKAVGGTRVRHHYVQLPDDLYQGLKDLAHSAGVPLKTVLLTAHLKVMSLLSGQSDVLTGLSTNGRPEEADGERIRGLFLNTLPFRMQLAKHTWRELLHKVFAAERAFLPFRRYPLSALQKQQSGPLFETMFNYTHFHSMEQVLRSGDLEILGLEKVEESSQSLLVGFSLDYRKDAGVLLVDSDATVLCEEQSQAIVAYFLDVLSAMRAEPDQPHHWRSFLTDSERAQLTAWNNTAAPYPETACLHQAFEAQAAKTPEAIALRWQNEQISYRDLNQQANRLAHHLLTLGVGPEVLVGICTDRSPEMLVAILAVLKAGGAYLPLDPTYPQERLAFMAEDAQIQVLLTQQQLMDHLPRTKATIICLDAEQTLLAYPTSDPALPLERAPQPDHLAYLIYTSGSTGQPKGVAITHRNAVAFVSWAQSVFEADDLRGVLASTSICFDLSIFELFVTLSSGGSVTLADNALQLPYLPAAREVTLINTVPSAMTELLHMGKLPPSVRVVNLAGEPLTASLAQQIHRQGTVQRLYNLYGPSEDTTYSTFTAVSADATPTIGRPIANTQVAILDAQMQPVPVGVPGELHLSGLGLARGYFKRPELTAERFIPSPFKSGDRLYRTGDLARWLPDGTIEYLSRIDHQVKIRGFRIELGEIEAALRQHEAVREAVVVARTAPSGEKRLVAYVVENKEQRNTGTQEHSTEDKSLRAFLKERLPDYMVPSAFVFLDALPLTANGKVDRKVLPEPELPRPELAANFRPPQTAMERRIASLWQEVLQLEQVGIFDNFFDLGGDSLKLARLHHKLLAALNQPIVMLDLFKHTTIHALAKHLDKPTQPTQPSFQSFRERAQKQKAALSRQAPLGNPRKKTDG